MVTVLRSIKKENIMKEIDQKLCQKTAKVHLITKPTIKILAAIITAAPNIKIISCPPSQFERTEKKIHKALSKVGINFEPLKLSSGRPKAHPDATLGKIHTLYQEGKSGLKISEDLDIPISTIYYYLKRGQNENSISCET